eukprot:5936266-Alexandrium_andersonii.AAC.2
MNHHIQQPPCSKRAAQRRRLANMKPASKLNWWREMLHFSIARGRPVDRPSVPRTAANKMFCCGPGGVATAIAASSVSRKRLRCLSKRT